MGKTITPRKPAKPGNIQVQEDWDQFPTSGMVKTFEPFIRNEVTKFCRRYPAVKMRYALAEAVKIAVEAEPKFKPELGYSFATFLGPYLKGLQRELHDRERKHTHVKIYERPDEKKRREEAEKGSVRNLNLRGGNGSRVVLDVQWHDAARETGSLIQRHDQSGGDTPLFKRHRIKAGAQLNSADAAHAIAVADRVSASARALVDGQKPSPKLSARMRAVFAHAERRQRETEQEAELIRVGRFESVHLDSTLSFESTDAASGVARQPPDFRPRHTPMARLDDAWSARPGEDGEGLSLKEIIPDTRTMIGSADRAARMLHSAIAKEWTFLNDKERHMLCWLRGDLGKLTQEQAGARLGLSKGYSSKIVSNVKTKLAKHFKK